MNKVIILLALLLTGCEVINEYDCNRSTNFANAIEQCIAEPSCLTDSDDLYMLRVYKARIVMDCER